MLMREVDEAVRQDEVSHFGKKYGWPLGIAFVLAIAAFGGFLFWQGQSERGAEEQSEQLVQAIDELEAGNTALADGELAELAAGEGGAAAAASMLRGGIALENGDSEAAAARFDEVANDDSLPAELRDIAAIRSVAARFDEMQPQAVIDRLGPLAVPGGAYYGSAGEMVAHAYLAQGKEDQAGPLLAAISRDEDVPSGIRARTRQLAGLLGYDAIDDVDAALAEITGGQGEQGSAELVE